MDIPAYIPFETVDIKAHSISAHEYRTAYTAASINKYFYSILIE
jgi:hypothetical protein